MTRVLKVKPNASGADRMQVKSRNRFRLPFLFACVAAAALLAPAAGAKQGALSWATPQIKAVVARGLMATDVASFQPNDPLTEQELEDLLPALPTQTIDESTTTDPTTTDPTTSTGNTTTTTTTTTGTTTTTPTGTDPYHDPTTTTTTTTSTDPTYTDTTSTDETVTVPEGPPPGSPKPGAPVTVTAFDTAVVNQLGLSEAADRFRNAARLAGLAPPKRFGTETVARLLGLRINHPAAQDKLELLPGQPITRAEAAYSVAQILSFRGDEAQLVDEASLALTLPALNSWQKRILNYAVSFIGYPYIWGGTSPKKQILWGQKLPGGFDCSGFVWRVYKLRSYLGGGGLSSTLRGRTTFVMSGEVPRSKRITFDNLQPADVIFFGLKGPASKPGQVNHTAIYLGGGWFIQSSGNGVDVVPLEGWYYKRFAWGRRPLAEAGLTNT